MRAGESSITSANASERPGRAAIQAGRFAGRDGGLHLYLLQGHEPDAHLRRLVRLRSQPHSATINPHGTVTNLVDTGSDDSYFASNDETMNQNGSAGLNLKWQASDNIAVELRRSPFQRRFGRRGLGHQQFRHRRSDPAGARSTSALPWVPLFRRAARVPVSPRPRIQIPTTSWIYAPPYTMSNLGTNTIEPLFGQANNTIFHNDRSRRPCSMPRGRTAIQTAA